MMDGLRQVLIPIVISATVSGITLNEKVNAQEERLRSNGEQGRQNSEDIKQLLKDTAEISGKLELVVKHLEKKQRE